jgi:hypothetical protein
MELITPALRRQLLRNAQASRAGSRDHRPVLKLFTPNGPAIWLLIEIDPENEDRAYGLCDVGLFEPELGYVSLAELARLHGMGVSVERDDGFGAKGPISVYRAEAQERGYIVA